MSVSVRFSRTFTCTVCFVPSYVMPEVRSKNLPCSLAVPLACVYVVVVGLPSVSISSAVLGMSSTIS